MLVRSSLAISILALAACGGDDGGGAAIDAPAGVDAKASNVMEVTCPATTPVTFVTQLSSFNPMTATITLGQIVKFDTSSTLEHPIGPIAGDPLSDPGLVVPAGKVKCFNFLATGMYRFKCTTHSYVGTLTVN